MTTIEKSKCCLSGLIEDTKTDPQDHHNVIEIYTCEKCNKECEVEEVCETCDGTGEVSLMGRVYQGEPHEALIDSGPCPDCNIKDNDDYDPDN